jgi:hypothetical protein
LTPVNGVTPWLTVVAEAMAEDVIANIKARVAQCRRLADLITDDRTASILRQMAEEGEADVQRLQAERKPTDRQG